MYLICYSCDKPVYDKEENTMFCNNCGKQMNEDDKFCPNCGSTRAAHSVTGTESSAKKGLKKPIMIGMLLCAIIVGSIGTGCTLANNEKTDADIVNENTTNEKKENLQDTSQSNNISIGDFTFEQGHSITGQGDDIYYIDNSKKPGAIIHVNSSGKKREICPVTDSSSLCVLGDYIYYIDREYTDVIADETGWQGNIDIKLMSVKTDGSSIREIKRDV